MANTVFPLVRPIVDFWNKLTHDENFTELTSFKGGYGAGSSWHSKYLRSEKDKLNNEYLGLDRRFNEEPRLLDVIQDNLLRLTVFSGFERVFALRQAYGALKYRFFIPDSTLGTLGELFNQGFLKGYFRGALLNFIQFLGVGYHSLLWCQGSSLFQQLVYTSIFETAMFPLDTIKTLVYTDVTQQYKGFWDCFNCLGKTLENNGLPHLYRGIWFKLAYNAAFLFHLRNWYDDSSFKWVTTPLWLVSYAFLTLKTRVQVADTFLSFQSAGEFKFYDVVEPGLYKGLIPFAIINLLFSYQFYALYSHEAQHKLFDQLKEGLNNEFKSPIAEKRFS